MSCNNEACRIMAESRDYWRRLWHELVERVHELGNLVAEAERLSDAAREQLTQAHTDRAKAVQEARMSDRERELERQVSAQRGLIDLKDNTIRTLTEQRDNACADRDRIRAKHDELGERLQATERQWQKVWRTSHRLNERAGWELKQEEEAHQATRRELEALRELCDLCRVCGSELSRSERAEETSCDEHPGRLCASCACPDCPPADAGGDDQEGDEHEP